MTHAPSASSGRVVVPYGSGKRGRKPYETPRLCDITDCTNKHVARGLCPKHYQAARTAGTLPPIVKRPRKPKPRTAGNEKVNAWHREYLRHYAYGLPQGTLPQIIEAIGSACQLCGKELTYKTARVDHDHSCCNTRPACGGCVRGILCNACNTGLGVFRDDPNRLAAAIAYLNGPRLQVASILATGPAR